MKKEIWGVNVIGNQGVNAENDFAIGANEAGDDVIIKIKDAEISGEEFATLKEIAEGGPTPGGGGFPEQDLNDPTFVPEANHYYKQKAGEKPAPVMTAIKIGDVFDFGNKIHFDTTKEAELKTYLGSIDWQQYMQRGGLLLAADANDRKILIFAMNIGEETPIYIIMANDANDTEQSPISRKILYNSESMQIDEQGTMLEAGFHNLDDNGDYELVSPIFDSDDLPLTIDTIEPENAAWNGTMIGVMSEAPESEFTDGVIYFYDGEEYHAITGEGGEGGGMPDPADAEDGDVIKVTVTPAEYEADPKIAVGDVITDLWALNSVVPDLSQLSYDDHRFEQRMGSVVADLMRGTYTVTEHGESQELTFTIAAANFMGIGGILMFAGQTPEQEQPNDFVFYITGQESEYGQGWVTGAPLQDGYANLMVMPFDEHPHLPELTITELANQDVWCKWIGKQKPFRKVKDEVKEAGWGKPYPAFTKANQVLTSAGESYMLMPTNKKIPLSGPGRFYFNTDLSIDQMDENLGMMVRNGMSGMELRIRNTKNESEYSLAIGGKQQGKQEYVVRYIVYVKDPGNGDDPIFSWVYATADYDLDAEGTTLHMTHGWNQEEINNCTWDGNSETYVDAIHSDYAMILPIYGSIFTIQEGLYYGDVKNAKTEWKDPIDSLDQLKLDPSEMDSWGGARNNQNFVVYNITDDKPHYMSMDNVKEEVIGSISHKYLHHIKLEASMLGDKGKGCAIMFDFVAESNISVVNVNQLLALKNNASAHIASGVYYLVDVNASHAVTMIQIDPSNESFTLSFTYDRKGTSAYNIEHETFSFNAPGATYYISDYYPEQL